MEGIADLAIRRKQPFVSGKFRERPEDTSGKYWPFLTAQAGEGVKNYARDYDLVS